MDHPFLGASPSPSVPLPVIPVLPSPLPWYPRRPATPIAVDLHDVPHSHSSVSRFRTPPCPPRGVHSLSYVLTSPSTSLLSPLLSSLRPCAPCPVAPPPPPPVSPDVPPLCSLLRPPRRDWRSLLPDLEQMVPWPRGEGRGRRTQAQVLESVLGYIQYLQRTLSILQGGAGCSGGGGSTEVGLSAEATEGQQLVPYEEEEEELGEGCSPWLGPTGPYWEAVGWEGAVPLSPPTQQEGLLGLSPSLLASPPPPGPPDEVIRGGFGGPAGGGWTVSLCPPCSGSLCVPSPLRRHLSQPAGPGRGTA
ncbi:uncharacterized protein LOC135177811 [Pogoniulus pusillus]|uniref:uncharacterized protein LOC135177811 n=1 Tax=Pogoniulus pusillus TaxID=488313 RepID=UPI0030B9A29C